MANYDKILKLLAITISLLVVNGKLLDILEDQVIMTNDSIWLSCRSDKKAEIQWYRRDEYLYAGGKFYGQDNDRLRMDIDVDQVSRTYTLVIREARHEDAGVYSCREDEGRGDSSSANLTVMNTRLLCESNLHATGYIGPNTCNLQQENMTFSCSVSFNGKPPHLVWRASNDSQPINSSVCDHQPNRVNCQLTLASDPCYDGTFFTCLTAQPSRTRYSCSTNVIKVQYFALDHELQPMEKIVNEEVECSVRSNLNPRFEWLTSEDNQETVVSSTHLHVIRESGLYWCNVSYSIRDVQCSLLASVVYAHKSAESTSMVLAVVLGLFVFLFLVTVFTLFIYIMKMKREHGKDKTDAFTTLVTKTSKRRDAFLKIWEDKALELEKKLFQSQHGAYLLVVRASEEHNRP